MDGGFQPPRSKISKPSSSIIPSVPNTSATVPLPQLKEEDILSILKRLPVKSILRFKWVSKKWRSLFSSANFISIHREEICKNPLNHSFIIECWDDDYVGMCLVNVDFTETEPLSVINPFEGIIEKIELVGSINGLVCLFSSEDDTAIVWNPAMKIYKTIDLDTPKKDSLGFAYDSVSDDYKIIQILKSRVTVYSASSNSWKTVQIDFRFNISDKSIVIAKGVPYWPGEIYVANNQSKPSKVLLYYDMQNESFKHVPIPNDELHYSQGRDYVKAYVGWKGNLGRIVGKGEFLDIWVYNEMGVWNKISSHGPIGLNITCPLQCSRDGVVLAETKEGKLMLYDPVTKRIKELPTGTSATLYEIVPYTQSLVTIEEMKPVPVLYRGRIQNQYSYTRLLFSFSSRDRQEFLEQFIFFLCSVCFKTDKSPVVTF